MRLLAAVAASQSVDRVVRVYRPWPTVAMTRRESLMPGFDAACAAARSRGFAPVVRPTGGRTVAYDPSCFVVDVVEGERGGRGENTDAFIDVGERFVRGLRAVDVDARRGPVPHEYCPGDYSVNARGVVKLVGTAQRVTRGARLVSASVPLGPVDALANVLEAVNAALDFDWNPATFGSVGLESAAASPTEAEEAILSALLEGPVETGSLTELLRPAS
ncbi:MAG: biotin/lipoate A/B protein ligase family protein [Actinomycetes bacterium]